MDVRAAFGVTVKQYRQKLEMSQEKFALLIGMDRTYYASVELGRRNVSLLNIQKIADGLNVSMEELFSTVDSYIRS